MLVDLHKGVLRTYGYLESVDEFFADKLGMWDIWHHFANSLDAFWMPMNQRWWMNLDWTPDGSEILNIAESMFGEKNVYLWSTPSGYPGCKEGKWRWVKKHLPSYEQRLVLGGAKFLGANPLHVLIDDGDHNILPFEAKGGRPCLVPRLWNLEHRNAHKAVEMVSTKLRLL